MKKEIPKIAAIFLITVVTVVWGLNFIFFGKAPKSKATGETINLTFNPATVPSAAAGSDFTVKIAAKPSINALLRGYDTRVNFDKTKLAFKSIAYLVGSVSSGFGNTDADAATINSTGVIKVMGEIQTPTGYSLTSASGAEMISLTFTVLNNSSTSVTIGNSTFSSINADMTLFTSWTFTKDSLGVNGGAAVTSTPEPTTPPGQPTNTPVPTTPPGQPTNTPVPTTPPGQPTNTPVPGAPTNTPTPTETVTGNVKLNLKLKFQGILKKPTITTMNVRVKLSSDSLTASTEDCPADRCKTVTFTANDDGTWSGSPSFNLTPGAGYTIYIKGPYHLQKKICDAVPTETDGGTYRCSKGKITLVAGNNDLDLSGIISLTGDLPDQDGTVSAYDTSFIYNNLGKTDNDKCDVNRNGICNTQDYSLVIAALTVKNDEQ